jgi:TolB-like protein
MSSERSLPSAGSRPILDSWKEIAAYLSRSVRTVRRWEGHEALPVHRHLHDKQATVYAYADEIDAWLKRRWVAGSALEMSAGLELQPSPGPASETAQKDRPIRPVTIAILPLRNLSGDPEQERFADGLTEELISEIGHVSPKLLRVIALKSVMLYKQSAKSIRQIGRELGVGYILEGGIRRYGRRVRLTARLIAARDQANIWADTYEIQLPPLFLLQRALAQQVTDSLTAELQVAPGKEARAQSAHTFAAHDAYLEGSSHFLSTEEDIKKRIEQLSLAVERDPEYAVGYGELAFAHFRLAFLWNYPLIEILERLKGIARKAIRLDGGQARAHTALAAFYLFRAWNWSKAKASSRRALALNPSDAWARIIRAGHHLVVREIEEAIEELGQARRLDPRSREVGMWIAVLAYFARRYNMAIERCQEVLQLEPSLAFAHLVLGSCYAQTGDYLRAVIHCEQARGRDKGPIWQMATACSVYAMAGQRDSAERLLQELLATKGEQYMRYIFLAQASVGLGDNEQTLAWLEKALEQRDPLLVFLKADPRFDCLSGLPRFQDLLRRIGLPN